MYELLVIYFQVTNNHVIKNMDNYPYNKIILLKDYIDLLMNKLLVMRFYLGDRALCISLLDKSNLAQKF
jgi:hypothetical protein